MAALDNAFRELRFALRRAMRAPAFSLSVVGVLAPGIGANVALVSYVRTQLHSGWPGVSQPDRFVRLSFFGQGDEFPVSSTPAPGSTIDLRAFELFRERQTAFDGVICSARYAIAVDGEGGRNVDTATLMTDDFFRVLNPHLALGAVPEDQGKREEEISEGVFVSYRYWKTVLRGGDELASHSVTVNGVVFRVVGVLPPDFPGTDLWLPVSARAQLFLDSVAFEAAQTRPLGVAIVAHLKPGMTLGPAAIAATAAATGLLTVSELPVARVSLVPLSQPLAASASGDWLLGVISIIILSISCINATILMLARAAARHREIAVRLALGAPRSAIALHLFAESVVLSTVAAAAALGLLSATAQWLLWRSGVPGPIVPQVATVFATIGLAGLAGLVSAVLPVLYARRVSISGSLKEGAAGIGRRSAWRLRFLVVAQSTLGMALGCTAGVFIGAFRSTLGPPLGVEVSSRVFITSLDFSMMHARETGIDSTLKLVRERIGALSGVSAVGLSARAAFGDGVWESGYLGSPNQAVNLPFRPIGIRLVDAGYFEAMGVTIARGRPFGDGDTIGAAPTVIVDEDVANTSGLGAKPLGSLLLLTRIVRSATSRVPVHLDTLRARIVGIAGIVQGIEPTARKRPLIYLSRRAFGDSGATTVIVKAARARPSLAPAIDMELRRVMPGLGFRPVVTSAQIVGDAGSRVANLAVALGAVGALALFLASAGVYATIARMVSERAREIGMRLALGAQPRQILGLFVREGLRLSLIGFAVGVPLALSLSALISLRYGHRVMLSLPVVISTLCLLLLAALLASWLPARLALRIDYRSATRAE